jgi:16S rRNA (guanine527-N7)-methyltransferase
VLPNLHADVITARAFAPLDRLLPLAALHLKPGGRLILLKGSAVDDEVTLAQRNWNFDIGQTKSLTNETGSIITLTGLHGK